MDDFVTATAYAAETGVTKQAISKQLKRFVEEGKIQVHKSGRSVLFSRAAYEAAKAGTGSPDRELAIEMAREPSIPLPEPVSLQDDPYRMAAGLEKEAKAKRAQLELRRLEGDLVDRQTVEREQFQIARHVRGAVMAACSTAADKVSTLPEGNDVRAVKAVLLATFKDALAQISEGMDSPQSDVAGP